MDRIFISNGFNCGIALAVRAGDEHGGNVYSVASEDGCRLAHLVDFSASINPLGHSKRVRRVVMSALTRAVHYPDPYCTALRLALARLHGLDPAQFIIGNGSSELIHLLPRALPMRHALILGPTFSEYTRAVRNGGGQVSHIYAERANHYLPPVEQAIALLQVGRAKSLNQPRIDGVFLCNPNSPTGQPVQVEDVLDLLQVVSDRKAWLVVDETFVEYCNELSVLPTAGRNPRVIVLRSFTKFYALAGLRIGYLASTKAIVERVRKHQAPWSVNCLAQEAALAALHDRSHARRSLRYMMVERSRFASQLKMLPGITVYPSAANFLLLELPGSTRASPLTQALRRHGLLVRDCSSVPGLNSRTIRVAVRTSSQNHRLLTALRSLLMS